MWNTHVLHEYVNVDVYVHAYIQILVRTRIYPYTMWRGIVLGDCIKGGGVRGSSDSDFDLRFRTALYEQRLWIATANVVLTRRMCVWNLVQPNLGCRLPWIKIWIKWNQNLNKIEQNRTKNTPQRHSPRLCWPKWPPRPSHEGISEPCYALLNDHEAHLGAMLRVVGPLASPQRANSSRSLYGKGFRSVSKPPSQSENELFAAEGLQKSTPLRARFQHRFGQVLRLQIRGFCASKG